MTSSALAAPVGPAPRPRAPVLRRCACGGPSATGGECQECRKKRLQRSASTSAPAPGTAPAAVHEVLRSPGQPLDAPTRAFMEPRFGHSFADVRVHADAPSARSAAAVGARAYAVGTDVVFGAGSYAPASAEGRRLIAHELAHVVQQSGTSPATLSPSLEMGPAEAPEEREADAVAERVLSGGAAEVGLSSGGKLARKDSPTPTLGGAPPDVDAGIPCSKAQNDAVEDARRDGAVMVGAAYRRLAGVGPAAPARPFGGAEARDPGDMRQESARRLARTLLGPAGGDLERVRSVMSRMHQSLNGTLPRVCASPKDDFCPGRDAYVRGSHVPVHFCGTFFRLPPRVQTRLVVHESAHLAGIGDPASEAYCTDFDCETDCGGAGSADAWAHLAHCAAGLAADPHAADNR
jgi:hypothetical protein